MSALQFILVISDANAVYKRSMCILSDVLALSKINNTVYFSATNYCSDVYAGRI